MAFLEKVRSTFSGKKALDNDPMRTGKLPSDTDTDDIKIAVFDQLFERSRKRKESRYHGK